MLVQKLIGNKFNPLTTYIAKMNPVDFFYFGHFCSLNNKSRVKSSEWSKKYKL